MCYLRLIAWIAIYTQSAYVDRHLHPPLNPHHLYLTVNNDRARELRIITTLHTHNMRNASSLASNTQSYLSSLSVSLGCFSGFCFCASQRKRCLWLCVVCPGAAKNLAHSRVWVFLCGAHTIDDRSVQLARARARNLHKYVSTWLRAVVGVDSRLKWVSWCGRIKYQVRALLYYYRHSIAFRDIREIRRFLFDWRTPSSIASLRFSSSDRSIAVSLRICNKPRVVVIRWKVKTSSSLSSSSSSSFLSFIECLKKTHRANIQLLLFHLCGWQKIITISAIGPAWILVQNTENTRAVKTPHRTRFIDTLQCAHDIFFVKNNHARVQSAARKYRSIARRVRRVRLARVWLKFRAFTVAACKWWGVVPTHVCGAKCPWVSSIVKSWAYICFRLKLPIRNLHIRK